MQAEGQEPRPAAAASAAVTLRRRHPDPSSHPSTRTSTPTSSSAAPPAVPPAARREEEAAACRICLDTTPPLLQGLCACRNTTGFVHRHCLELWLSSGPDSVRRTKATTCDICRSPYRFSTHEVVQYKPWAEHVATFCQNLLGSIQPGRDIPRVPEGVFPRTLGALVCATAVALGTLPFLLVPRRLWFPFFAVHETARQLLLCLERSDRWALMKPLARSSHPGRAWLLFSLTVGPSIANVIMFQAVAVGLGVTFHLGWRDLLCLIFTQTLPFLVFLSQDQVTRLYQAFQSAGEDKVRKIVPLAHDLGLCFGPHPRGPDHSGLLVRAVLAGRAGHLAGVVAGDIILASNRRPVHNMEAFKAMPHRLRDVWVVERQGQRLQLTLPG